MNRKFTYWVRSISLIVLLWVLVGPLFAQLDISVSYGPPALPVYEQPACPAEGYAWTPGYWAWVLLQPFRHEYKCDRDPQCVQHNSRQSWNN
jgi:hypothetical protein